MLYVKCRLVAATNLDIWLFPDFIADPEQEDCTHNGSSDFTNPSGFPLDANEIEEPAANETAKETEEEIPDAAVVLAAHELASKQSGKDTNDKSVNHVL